MASTKPTARLWMIIVIYTAYCQADFTTECPIACDCKWQSGNKAASCTDAKLTKIPDKLSHEIQNLELSNNPLKQLPQETFKNVGLNNLKKLVLRDCIIEYVNKKAFATLGIIIEIDLSRNLIKSLDSETFKETEKLRWINLSNNLIVTLEDGLFVNMKYLQRIELSNNMLINVGVKTFVNLPRLQTLRLDGNNLTNMNIKTLDKLDYLSSLDLHNNPWNCDCKLQPFRNWVISKNLYTKPTSCESPIQTSGKLWVELETTSFACKPTILVPKDGEIFDTYDVNATLICKVVANPPAEVYWKFNSRIIETRNYGELKYILSDNTIGMLRWVNITIINVKYSDRGNYTCIAENPGGHISRNVTLALSKASFSTSMNGEAFFIIMSCMGLTVLIISVFITICYCSFRRKSSIKYIKNERSRNNDGFANCSTNAEIEKGIVSDVNPIAKPPRRFEAPPSVASEATEMSELNRTLLDNESNGVSNEDERCHELDSIPNISQEKLLIDKITQEQQAYPPDLLSFPLGTSFKQRKHNNTTDDGTSDEFKQRRINSQCPPNKGYVTLPRRNFLPILPNTYYRRNSDNRSNLELNKAPYHIQNCSNERAIIAGQVTNFPRNSLSSPNIHNQLLTLQTFPNCSIYTNKRLPLNITLTPPRVNHNGVKSVKKFTNFKMYDIDNEFYLGERATQV